MFDGTALRFATVMVVGGLVAAGCGELVEPEAFSPTTSTSIGGGVEQETASQVQQRPGLATGVNELVPSQEGYVPTLLISGSQFIVAVDGPDSVPLAGPLAGLQTTRAVDDLGGGLVVEEVEGPVVYRTAQGGAEVLDETGATLLDVGYWDGSPRAFVEVGSGQVDWIQLVSEPGVEHERQTHLQFGEDEEIVAFSANRDLQAAIVQDDRCGELRFYGAMGQILDLQGPEPPACNFPSRPSFGAVALSPDGGAVAYTIVRYRSDGTEAATDLVARELTDGSDFFFTRRIAEELEVVTSLTFDGERAAYVKVADDEETVTLLDLTVSSSELAVDLLNAGEIHSVSFARIPVALVG